ncbi:hypothetical protein LCGC14_3067250, partial [marine sediment metagenome]
AIWKESNIQQQMKLLFPIINKR